ncbi:SDR family NAD(P)-dependent oxidoreductase [Mucilaginibacter sp. SP1R1]|uniref:SDR family NAD(P)-dependent oxidoreductase n=1 Tax=Mucilaginibacter sp. SP1R1 TaxID=2723091 RepID=UPI0016222143|nr:SDR family oxidoreductase [Mucilaginibacter sp. SP1R1]MBB6149113.1 NAD(P)-dependent dehydrogenase (short-subunit alcohol dehydrogenase family) [Mucilaginibacter sp. SP1R1]
METKSKIAIVTGGASGLGLAITKKFTEHNIKTIIIGRDEKKLQTAADTFGPLCNYKACDLSNIATIPALIEEITSEFGTPDILVNNAGINMKKSFTEVTDEDFQNIIQTNLTAVFVMSREVSKKMIGAGTGAIVNISSMASQYGIPYVIAYTASKAAIEGMTRAMATELSPIGIRINCVAPGFIATDMSAKALNNDPERKNKVLSRTPMGKLGDPDDIAEAVLYLSSDASRYVTGVILPVDGGNSIGF